MTVTTEMQHPLAVGLDEKPATQALEAMLHSQQQALAAVRACMPQIETAASYMTRTLRQGGRLAFVGAGVSALMAYSDGGELNATFGIPSSRVRVFIPFGLVKHGSVEGACEDDIVQALRDSEELQYSDLVIAVSASGSTPYTLTMLQQAKHKHCKSIAICNCKATPMAQYASLAIELESGPEVIAGSTRMAAGTSQKIALNLMSSLMGMQLGHVHDGYMVSLYASNAKLKQRAAEIVANVGHVAHAEALDLLTRTDGDVKAAILLAAGAAGLSDARFLLDQTQGHLRPALQLIANRGQMKQDRWG